MRPCTSNVVSRLYLIGACVATTFLLVAATAGAARIETYSAGLSSLQAGGHPDQSVNIKFATEPAQGPIGERGGGGSCFGPGFIPGPCQVIAGGAAKDILTSLPAGFLGNPQGVAECTFSQLTAQQCPPASQVGVNSFALLFAGLPEVVSPTVGVFNVVPRRGELAEFGMNLSGVNTFISFSLRNSPQVSIEADVSNIDTVIPLNRADLTIWGVPGAMEHDPQRVCAENNEHFGCTETPSSAPVRPVLANGADCSMPGRVETKIDAWQTAGSFETRTGEPQTLTGCDKESFTPGLSVKPTTAGSDSPSGLDVDISVRQTWDNAVAAINSRNAPLATPPLRKAVVTLPAGMSISPSQATGLGACTDAQFAVSAEAPPSCPGNSKVAEAELSTPLLSEKVGGALYLGTQLSSDPQSGEMYRLFMALENEERGLVVKIPGKLEVDPTTGQVTAIFAEAPQLPFSDLKLHFNTGPRAPLSTPVACGKYTTQAELTSWATGMAPVKLSSSFQITSGPNGSPCPPPGGAPLDPKLDAGTINPVGGAYSPFVLRLQREDGRQELSAIGVKLPEGLLGKLAGIPYCPDSALAAVGGRSGQAELASPSCPAAAQVGTVTVGAGPGTMPFYLDTGKAYLAGPYKGAPLSLAIVTPAVAGPFDLGDVMVRAALDVDPRTTQISVQSDPLPHILGGVPLQIRDLRVNIDRNQFTLNPTSCDPMAIDATVTGTGGSTANLSNRFQVGSCASLAFGPKLKILLKGATRRVGHPALKAVLTAGPGEANIGRAQVNLPHGEFLDQGNLNKTCTRPVLLARGCPASSVYGRARAWSPLLEKPLEGNVYLVGGYGYKLPALVADLNGQIRVLLVGKVDSGKNKGIRNTFEVVPDAPVSRFVLEMKGGRRYGLLENSENLCKATKARRRAVVRLTGHNGEVEAFKPVVRNQCGKNGKRSKNHRRHDSKGHGQKGR